MQVKKPLGACSISSMVDHALHIALLHAERQQKSF